MLAATTGNSAGSSGFSLLLCLGSLLLAPVVLMVHPPIGEMARDLVTPRLPETGQLSDVLLLISAIVGTTVAPWQLFFQQSYVIDKRITPRFMAYEKIDLGVGIVFVIVGAVAMMAFCAATFGGHSEAGNFTDAGGVAAGLAKYVGQLPATLRAKPASGASADATLSLMRTGGDAGTGRLICVDEPGFDQLESRRSRLVSSSLATPRANGQDHL